MKYGKLIYALTLLITCLTMTSLHAVPKINGTPKIVAPEMLLDWPEDFAGVTPYLTEPTANRLNDLHGEIGSCDIVLSTSGNYHMALREMWQDYLKQNARPLNIKTWYYTTSPPISPPQILNKALVFENLKLNCIPQVAVGPKKLMKKLKNLGLNDGKPVKVIKNYGNVIIVKKGNPKNIKSVWDLGRADVTLVTPNPKMESGSFGNFSGSIYNIAKNDPNPPAGMTADKLFNNIFNTSQENCGTATNKCRWVSGKRIMHREQPWAIYSGNADAGFIFYHLALYFTRTFPDQFEIVSLGGTASKPEPVKGNKIGVLQAVRIKGDWSKNQLGAQEKLMQAFQSDTFTAQLQRHGIRRP
jgi:formylmethanofuran dehydrogenase subunit D